MILQLHVPFVAALILARSAAADAPNLLRNGSFEGCLLYWHGTDPQKHTLVKDAKCGTYALHSKDGNVMSAPWVAEKGKDYTVSFWVKGDAATEVRVQMPGSAREESHRAGRLWTAEPTKSAKVTTDWQRVHFTWKADIPQSGFWPLPHYMVQIEGKGLTVDGMTVVAGAEGTKDYVPRAAVEVLAECPGLPGYAVNGNILEKGKPVRIKVHVSNASDRMKVVTLSNHVCDYEGHLIRPVVVPENKTEWGLWTFKTEPNQTASKEFSAELSDSGTVLLRTQVWVEQGRYSGRTPPEDRHKNIKSDECLIPLTSLAYPKSATKPDYRERFGGSFAGGIGMVKKLQSIGMSWIRWRPHCNGADHLPKEPADKTKPATWEWTWFDKELDEQEAHGFSSHLVLYPPPRWIMEKEHGGHPLPLDMRWPASDARWDDLSVMTVWDHFVEAAVKRYKDRAVVFEIENEPEFDQWMEQKLGAEYSKFTTRTARRIKSLAPAAKVMVNNVYGIPSAVNGELFKAKDGLKDVDILSWHDYHAGWLADATMIKRFRQNLDEAGGKHVAIWFNEGWAFTNTAVDEPPACTGLTAAQSTNAIMASVAEMTVSGQEKTVVFHTGYETHGMSFWDYSGPGTQLWDWYGNPTPLVAAWNVMAHHISLSEPIGLIRPPGCNLAVFHDLRNNRGVVVAYADREAKEDVLVNLGISLTREDIMGNQSSDSYEPPKISASPPKSSGKPSTGAGFPVTPTVPGITISKSGRLIYLYDGKTTGKDLFTALEKLDRRHQGFSSSAGGALTFTLPATWEGTAKGKADGNPSATNGKPVWRLDRLWPMDHKMAAHWSPMIWNGTAWAAPDHSHGGHPSATIENGKINFGTMGPWAGEMEFQKIPGLAFIAPETGAWRVTGTAQSKPWEGGVKVYRLGIYKKDTQRAAEVKLLELPRDGTAVPFDVKVDLTAGHELLLAPVMPDHHNATNTSITELKVVRE